MKRWRTNNDEEFINKVIQKLFQKKGIIHEKTLSCEHERNEIAARYGKSIDHEPWTITVGGSYATACYLEDHLPYTRLTKNITPYEALQGKKPIVQYLQPFGRNFYVYVHKDSRPSGTKPLLRAIQGKLWDTRIVITFIEFGFLPKSRLLNLLRSILHHSIQGKYK